VDIDAQAARDSTASDIWLIGVRRLVVANGPNIFQMLLVKIFKTNFGELRFHSHCIPTILVVHVKQSVPCVCACACVDPCFRILTFESKWPLIFGTLVIITAEIRTSSKFKVISQS